MNRKLIPIVTMLVFLVMLIPNSLALSNITDCDQSTLGSDIYLVENDINNSVDDWCWLVENDTTIDCQGHNLNFTGSAFLLSGSNITVANCEFHDSLTGVFSVNTSYVNDIENVWIYNNMFYDSKFNDSFFDTTITNQNFNTTQIMGKAYLNDSRDLRKAPFGNDVEDGVLIMSYDGDYSYFNWVVITFSGINGLPENISNATLELYDCTVSGSAPYNGNINTTVWAYDDDNWTTVPTSSLGAKLDYNMTTQTTVRFNVTDYVISKQDNSSDMATFVLGNPNGQNGFRTCDSRRGSKPPRLIINDGTDRNTIANSIISYSSYSGGSNYTGYLERGWLDYSPNYYIAGNFWDDYIGCDNDIDGIGDTSYLIDGISDYYDYIPLTTTVCVAPTPTPPVSQLPIIGSLVTIIAILIVVFVIFLILEMVTNFNLTNLVITLAVISISLIIISILFTI